MPSKQDGRWRARWRDKHGKLRSKNCDDHRTAKYVEDKMKAQVEEIRLRLRSPRPRPRTWKELKTAYWKNRAATMRSRKDIESIIRQLDKEIGDGELIADIEAERLDAYRTKLEDRVSTKTCYNYLTLLKAMLNTARKWDWLERVPCFSMPSIERHGQDFRFLRTRPEIRRFLKSAVEEGPLVFAMYAMAIYTGLRAGELAGLMWHRIDFDHRIVMVANSYAGTTKSDRARAVPILDALVSILKLWRFRSGGRGLVFPNRDGNMQQPSARIFQEVLHRVLDRAGFPVTENNGRKRWYITFHGLRHTFASQWAMSGGTMYKLQKILGHQSIELTERYAHLCPDAFVEDYGRFGGKANITGAEAAAVPIKRGAKKIG